METIEWVKDGKVMVRVPAGGFLYGDDKQKMDLPEFWIDKTPVTNAEYARFVAETECKPPSHWGGKTPPIQIATHPVVYVTWHDAVAYAEWAGKQLPPEEYWEKAARGTDGRIFPWGDTEPTDKLCNFGQGLVKALWSLVATTYYTTPVGQYSPQGDSTYGCVDMAGNVWEWTASLYQIDNKNYKILRGGSWNVGAVDLRCAVRIDIDPHDYYGGIGFRCFSVSV